MHASTRAYTPRKSSLGWLVLLGLCTAFSSLAESVSFYPVHLKDPRAVYLEAPSGGDDTAALQQAIDKVQSTTGQGVVFVAPGRYQITDTVVVWPGIRVIGMGATRPVLTLPATSKGFTNAAEEKVMIFFAGGRGGFGRSRRGDGAGARPAPDANPGTFYSALANVDIEIGSGNPGAVVVRSRYAQHCFLAHMDMSLGSALAGVHESGNVIEDVQFHGGRYGLWTSKPSPGWQLTVLDCSFDGQQESAIREREAGLTLVRPHFFRIPAAVLIETNEADELWIKDGRFEDISGPAISFGVEKNPRNEINMENVVCQRVPVFAEMQESGKRFSAPNGSYRVKRFSHGLTLSENGAPGQILNEFEAEPLAALPDRVPSDIALLPPAETWVNVRELGAKGDGTNDDTAALQTAIATHRALYFPMGFYVVNETLRLKPDTVLVGLHPGATQLLLPDGSEKFQGVGGPLALLEAPKGGSNIVIGIGLYTSGNNPRAVAALWQAGSHSMLNDVRFLGGHGTPKPDGSRENPYNPNHTADPDPNRHWDSQYPSLWVTGGGGGTFLDIWTPSTFASAGMLVSDTETEGRVYQMSSEHHVRNEVQLRCAAHWRLYALQTEEERGESGFALPLEIDSCRDVTVANFHSYRVISSYQPFPCAAKVSNSTQVRFRNFHSYSNSKVSFDSAIFYADQNREIRPREFAALDLGQGAVLKSSSSRGSKLLAAPGTVEKLAGGFFNISGGVASRSGNFYFVDAHWQRIYEWLAESKRLVTVSDAPLSPVNLALDNHDNLLVFSYAGRGTVYSLSNKGVFSPLTPSEVSAAAGKRFYLPVSDWRANRASLSHPTAHFVSPDGSTILPAGADFLSGAVSWGVKSSPQLRSFGLAETQAGQPFFVTDEAQLTTWSATVQPDGSLAGFTLFAEQGGENVTQDGKGNVWLAAGQIYVYDSKGKLLETIETPERPLQLVFGGADRRTLFICGRTALYAVRTRAPGKQAVEGEMSGS